MAMRLADGWRPRVLDGTPVTLVDPPDDYGRIRVELLETRSIWPAGLQLWTYPERVLDEDGNPLDYGDEVRERRRRRHPPGQAIIDIPH